MPAMEVADHNDKVVLYEASGVDDYGNPTVLSPVELNCRWEDAAREVITPDSGVVACDAVIFVSREIPVGSLIWRGALTDLPVTPTNLKQVIRSNSIPALKKRFVQRDCMLMRYSNKLPEIVAGTGT
jgi:hypothetical protein